MLVGFLLPCFFSAAAAAAEKKNVFEYDDSAFRKTDPALRRWVEKAPIRPEIVAPAGICAAGDTLYVTGERALLALSVDGAPKWKAALEEDGRCVTVAPDGRILVGVRRHVEVFDAAGKPADSWPDLGEEAVITSVAASTGMVFIADAGQRKLWTFDGGGRMLGRIGDKDAALHRDGFNVPSPHFDVAAAPDGSVWAANPGELRLEHYAADGMPLGQWGEPGFVIEKFCGCCNPADFALRPGGGFVTSEKGLPRIKTYDAAGKFTGVVAGAEDFDEDTVGVDVTVDGRGRVLALDPKRRLIRVFEPKEAPRP
jgi:hypothetical protein